MQAVALVQVAHPEGQAVQEEVPQYWPTVVPEPTAQLQEASPEAQATQRVPTIFWPVAHVPQTVALVQVVQPLGHAVQPTEPPVVVAATVKYPAPQAEQIATGVVAVLKAQAEHPVGEQGVQLKVAVEAVELRLLKMYPAAHPLAVQELGEARTEHPVIPPEQMVIPKDPATHLRG